ncbi:MAG: T9SS type A sorting domain-containing protein, partial [Schleiferiaceae bacterium]|nr:T9SS type A sorting domain-containing protein [Schleiferiaceae bacterium]
PNPASGITKLAIESAEAANYNMVVMDMTGRLVEMKDFGRLDAGRHIQTIDVTNYAAGVYFYTIESAGSKITKKLIVE